MAVRVRIRISGPSGEITSSAVLNGGFEIPEPHLLLPAACADRLLGDWRSSGAHKPMDAAGGEVVLVAAAERVRGRVLTTDREGNEVLFSVLVSEADREILVSDSGIDALGVRIESFFPGRWRLSDELVTRESEGPQEW